MSTSMCFNPEASAGDNSVTGPVTIFGQDLFLAEYKKVSDRLEEVAREMGGVAGGLGLLLLAARFGEHEMSQTLRDQVEDLAERLAHYNLREEVAEEVDILSEELEGATGDFLAAAAFDLQGAIYLLSVLGGDWAPFFSLLEEVGERLTHAECCHLAALRDAWGLHGVMQEEISSVTATPMAFSPELKRLMPSPKARQVRQLGGLSPAQTEVHLWEIDGKFMVSSQAITQQGWQTMFFHATAGADVVDWTECPRLSVRGVNIPATQRLIMLGYEII